MAAGLLEREEELALLVSRLDRAREGHGGIAIVEGAAGAGKTALLRALRAHADEAGDVRVLQAAGGELEREFAFGVVRQLLERVVRHAAPDRRAELLSGAAASAAPVVGGAPGGDEPLDDASFATLHGLYWLVATLADERPLALLVDDAHWADAPSLRFLDFLARRAHELPLLIVVGTRINEPGAEHELLDALALVPESAIAHPEALSEAAVRTMFGPDAPDDAVAAALDTTRGNPLLVRELVRSLQATGRPVTAEAVAAAVPASVARSVERRLARIPAAARHVARALAVLGDRTDRAVLADVVGLDPLDLDDALAHLRGIEVLEEDPPRFVHPVVRAATAEPLTSLERDRLHHRAAELLRTRPGAEEELVVQLLAARPLGEPWVVPALLQAARKAAAEGAPDAAVRRLERALVELPQDAPERFALQLELGRAAVRAGLPQARDHLAAASAAPDPELAARAVAERVASGALGSGDDPAPSLAALRGALDRLGPDGDAELRDLMTTQLLNVLTHDARCGPERIRTMAALPDDAGPGARAHQVYDAAASGVPRGEVVALAERLLTDRPFTSLAAVEHPDAFWAVVAITAVDGAELANAALLDAEATVRRHRTRLGGAYVAFMRAEWALAFGSAAAGEAEARSALEVFQAAAPASSVTAGLRSTLVRALTARGALDEAEAVLAELPPDAELGTSWSGVLTWTGRAALREAQGRHADAVADLERLDGLMRAFGWERMVLDHSTARRARALAACGRAEEARAIAEAEVAAARARDVPSFTAQALGALASTQSGDAAIATWQEAVAAAERAPALHVRAAAAYGLGAALRRAGLRVEAREHLATARDQAGRAGAAALAERATQELLVAGGRPRRVARDGVDALTPSERRTAEHAARGLSNREIAETLFVTRKTVEFTLGNVYSKLGIRSRTQLPEALGAAEPAPPAP